MRVERICYRGWPETWRCTCGPLELIVLTSMGPRILSLRLDGGENFLYEDTTGFTVGAWLLCGGHRFTTAPESDASYQPDNQPCHVSCGRGRLTVCQQLDDGLRRGLEITPHPGGAGFVLRHRLLNCGTESWHGAPWAITCVPSAGRVVVSGEHRAARFWTVPGERYADASSPQWQAADGCFVVEPRGRKGKVGLQSGPGWLAWLGADSTFVIRGPGRVSHASYPDEGCNVEVYTCAHYLELETLGPLTSLPPGKELVHVETWQVFPRGFSVTDVAGAFNQLAPPKWAHEQPTGASA
jgi:hypothetical protein